MNSSMIVKIAIVATVTVGDVDAAFTLPCVADAAVEPIGTLFVK